MSAGVPIDLGVCEALAGRAAAGDEVACQALVFGHLWPTWLHLVGGSRFLGPLRRSEDDVENVRTKLAEKIKRTIHTYPAWRARNAEKTLEDWNRIAVANTIRRYVRSRMSDPMAAAIDRDPSLKDLLNEFTVSPVIDRIGVRPPVTMAQTAAELLAFAGTHLGVRECRVLESWLQGARFDEIAVDLGLPSAEEAEKAQRAAVAVLRRAFRGG